MRERIAGHTVVDVNFDAPAVLPALLTPFDERGDVDLAALRDHVEFVIEAGVHGIMPCGTTGETALLEADEVIAVVEGVVEAAAGRVPVVAHVGRPSTVATARLIEPAIAAGAAGVSAIVPYYYAFDDREIVAHFRALLKVAGDTPLLAYEFPDRTGNRLSAEAFGTLVGDGLAGPQGLLRLGRGPRGVPRGRARTPRSSSARPRSCSARCAGARAAASPRWPTCTPR